MAASLCFPPKWPGRKDSGGRETEQVNTRSPSPPAGTEGFRGGLHGRPRPLAAPAPGSGTQAAQVFDGRSYVTRTTSTFNLDGHLQTWGWGWGCLVLGEPPGCSELSQEEPNSPPLASGLHELLLPNTKKLEWRVTSSDLGSPALRSWPPLCKDPQAALWTGPRGEELRPLPTASITSPGV